MEKVNIYPFNDVSIEQIKSISNMITYDANGHIEKEITFKQSFLNKNDEPIVNYFYFLNMLIVKYEDLSDQFNKLDLSLPIIEAYMNAIIKTINDEVNEAITTGNINIIKSLNALNLSNYYSKRLFEVISYLLESKGYVIDNNCDNGYTANIVKSNEKTFDITLVIDDLLKRSNFNNTVIDIDTKKLNYSDLYNFVGDKDYFSPGEIESSLQIMLDTKMSLSEICSRVINKKIVGNANVEDIVKDYYSNYQSILAIRINKFKDLYYTMVYVNNGNLNKEELIPYIEELDLDFDEQYNLSYNDIIRIVSALCDSLKEYENVINEASIKEHITLFELLDEEINIESLNDKIYPTKELQDKRYNASTYGCIELTDKQKFALYQEYFKYNKILCNKIY